MATKFWRAQDLPTLARRWLEAGADAVSLVVVGPPTSEPGRLWRDLSAVLDIPADPVPHAPRANRALGAVEIEVLRRMHAALPKDRDKVRSAHLSSKFFSRLLRDLDLPWLPPRVPAPLVEAVQHRAASDVAALGTLVDAGRLTVVGSLDDLIPSIRTTDAPVPEELVAQASTRVLGTLVAHEARTRNEVDELRAELADHRRPRGSGGW